jgi:hypothetical protein
LLLLGTGLAPFRGFIQERDLHKKDGKNVGDTILYFGCRKKSQDYLYQEVGLILDLNRLEMKLNDIYLLKL